MVNDQIKNVCKIGQGNACCRYLVMAAGGFHCEKLGGLKDYLDIRVEMGTLVARGDNCLGKPDDELNTGK